MVHPPRPTGSRCCSPVLGSCSPVWVTLPGQQSPPEAYDVRRRRESASYNRAWKDVSRASHVRRDRRRCECVMPYFTRGNSAVFEVPHVSGTANTRAYSGTAMLAQALADKHVIVCSSPREISFVPLGRSRWATPWYCVWWCFTAGLSRRCLTAVATCVCAAWIHIYLLS